MSEIDKDLAIDLCLGIDDWNSFIDLSVRKFSAPMVYQNLTQIFHDDEYADEMARMRKAVLQIRMETMRVFAAHLNFHNLCILPLDIEYVYLKGLALAAGYYSDPTMRFSRDIDLLVLKGDSERVVRAALANGYDIKVADQPATNRPNEETLQALLKYNPVLTFLSPEGILIEIHRDVDKNLGIITPELLLDDPIEIMFAKTRFMAPNTAISFCYCSLHNSRHSWSRLHWLADLGAMIQHPSFDLDRVLQVADAIGLRPNIDAVLELEKLSRSVGRLALSNDCQSHGSELLELCLQNLSGGMDVELQIRSRHNLFDLPISWLLSDGARIPALIRRSSKRILPSFYQYEAFPLPARLQWLYIPTKPIFAIMRMIRNYRTGR